MFLKTKHLLKTQIIINPESDRGRTGKKWQQIKEALHKFFAEFKCEFTEKPLHAIEICRSAIKDGSELIIGIGGDGTMNELANGFFERNTLINPDSVLGVVPSGTGSDFSRSLNIPYSFFKSMKIISEAPIRNIDLGRVRFRNQAEDEEERFFLNITDFGIGGEVVKRVNQMRLKHKAASYLLCLVSVIAAFKNKRLRIRIDGRSLPLDEYMIGAVSNGRIFGKGMKIAPHALLDDGLFDVILIKGMRMADFFLNAWRLYTGNHLSHPKIEWMRGREIAVESYDEENHALIEVDGEQLGHTPAEFHIIPGQFPVKAYI